MKAFELIVKGRALLIDLDNKHIYDSNTGKKVREMTEDDIDYFRQIASYHITRPATGRA